MRDLSESLSDNYGQHETSSLSQQIQSARSSARENFEGKVRQVRSSIEAVRKQVHEIAQENIRQGGPKKLWESKMAQADHLARNDQRVQDLFKNAMPKNLERKINLKTYEMFKVDKNFVESYRNYTKNVNQKEHERQAAREKLEIEFREWLQKVDVAMEPHREEIRKHNEYVDWWNAKQETMTVNEFYHTHPKIWAWFEWRLAHYRLDFDKSDEDYAKELKDDHTYWPLPRNP